MALLEINQLRKEYASLVAVNDLNLTIDKGQVLGLIGPNGAGKTTLLRMLATVLPPTDGTALIDSIDLRKKPLEIRKKIGYLPDFFNLYRDLTLTECLDFFARAYQVPTSQIPARIAEVLDYVNLTSKQHDFVRHLSRGMVQRLGLAVLLVHDPDILLLDEPASGLDPMARIQLRDILKRLSSEGKTIVISSHILTELAGFCTHVGIMNQGNLVLSGSIDEIEREISGSGKIILKILEDSERASSLIRDFPGIILEEAFDSTFHISVESGPETVAALNAHLVSNHIRVIHISERKSSLEDLFMQISRDKNLTVS